MTTVSLADWVREIARRIEYEEIVTQSDSSALRRAADALEKKDEAILDALDNPCQPMSAAVYARLHRALALSAGEVQS